VDKSRHILSTLTRWILFAGALVAILAGANVLISSLTAADQVSGSQHVVTIYDDNAEKTVVTRAQSIAEALKDAQVTLSDYDSIHPSIDSSIQSAPQVITIHRARPVVIVDGSMQTKVITAQQSMIDIAKAAGITMYAEDTASLDRTEDVLIMNGAALEVRIARAKTVYLELYGQSMTVRTRAETIGEFLSEKAIVLKDGDGMNVDNSDLVNDEMTIRIWRDGIQTVTATEAIPYATKIIKDQTRKYGYREIQSNGQNGQKTVIYQIEVKDGQEINRSIISQVINVEQIEQVEIVGMKSDLNVPALSPSRGAQVYRVGSITRKETYYDLSMSVVMKACGQGGYYEVRSDGVKVDRDGYVIVAANLHRYPRCSEVDTSVGRGKVYDTGGFAVNSPEQFDIATDWSNRNGR
jgi:uncharacterized protein YabE (DUF348 family)